MLHVWWYKESIGRSIIQVWVWPQDITAAFLSKRDWHRGKLAWFAKGFVGLWGDFFCMLCPLEITVISDACLKLKVHTRAMSIKVNQGQRKEFSS